MTRTSDKQTIGVVSVTEQRRRRLSVTEMAALVRQTNEPGMRVSLIARLHGVGASQLFNWRKLDREGALMAVGSGEFVVPASELACARAQIAQLRRRVPRVGIAMVLGCPPGLQVITCHA